jgi:hypothetical protein
VSTLIKPHLPIGSKPSRDEDPTGVRALLSSLPEPDPMPEHLVERINASLAAEQAKRAAKLSSASVTPLLATARRRRPRLLFAIAGAAAAVVLIAAVGINMFTGQGTTASSGVMSASRSSDSSSSGAEGDSGAVPSAAAKAQTPLPLVGRAPTPPLVQIGLSGTRYTQADFVTQARTLRRTPLQQMATATSGVGPAGTARGLMECLNAIGVTGAQVVRADVAFYEGRPAVIIVTTTNGVPMAYAVGRQCSPADAAILRPATPLS